MFDAVLREARKNPEFAATLERAFGGEMLNKTATRKALTAGSPSKATPRRSNRRAKAAVDPFGLLSVGEAHLRAQLANLDIEQLKDVVAEYGMDTSRLALKWKSRERLTDFIVMTVVARTRKGDVFREGGSNTSDAGSVDAGESLKSSL